MRLKAASISFIALSALLLFFPVRKAHAWPWDVFTQIGENFSHNIRQTVTNATTSLVTDVPSQAINGRNMDQVHVCMDMIAQEYTGKSLNLGTPPPGTDGLSAVDDCSDLKVATPISGKYGFPTQNKSTGSLVGIATILEDISQNEPGVLNLAVYTKHVASKIPIVNKTAYAADSIEDILLTSVIQIWEKIRNLSYGILGLFMVAIGIMIILRQKINPQTVVTVQYAIPRIIIAVILITFSYPIGALAMQAIVPVSQLAFGILNLSDTSGLSTLPAATLGNIAFTILTSGFAGLILLLLEIAGQLVLLYFIIRILVQIILCYVKIAVSVLAGPLIFAWGAIPGNEETTENWFKALAVNVVSVPIMAFVLGLHKFIQINMVDTLLVAPKGQGLSWDNVFGGTSTWGIIFFIVLQVGILMQGVSAPAKIEEMINGPKSFKKK